ncbi:hypothetical protein BKA82DRAFT_1008683 [Pisolithus tinctorius]|uniref:Uncharacterized protein n=1 Tax=Pisolithus tinctorius Marx 270 TaxID=870435 RepID=A0A0C3NDR3_PISTI|nr:hypothetical protein BKA82DRAFT_1008683 [Pisolithus tinctorius]KIN93915.1 hypothetical protein M404DRAFT_1008683 [Pisolithus tinctorius Marx 270]
MSVNGEIYAVKVRGRSFRVVVYQPSNQTDQDQFTVTHTPRLTPSSSFPLQSD